MGAFGAGSALGMGGLAGGLNGVSQMPAGTASPHAAGAAASVTLPVNNRYARPHVGETQRNTNTQTQEEHTQRTRRLIVCYRHSLLLLALSD